ncbi:2-amino-4-hydroxy-6-hydroxymethyldihydropteridine pyrophosphokinase [Paraliobacillus ryukyuensis]|uniref:2-amino-4-hydroxy-6-hydroxymethyldihydropteridine diphosphokinase n=1 Tax=Paraliobacillus ryukyuensis TaxID=200904 RepID=A0A366DMF9_9BACI|nr:2-amino-4-hydroxy-6-hydroxymethyldihydropteridine diphosphokinase [Paraliobacillus ryukyuensis]RBO91135.1 2-amino-4-hydroxy-6-hydroxymethyldihydropteridine diphosphokinase [Paraliobacillus ryukyuensis]
MTTCYIALGSNISPRYEYLTEAIDAFRKCKEIKVTSQSSIYETAPVGVTDQAYFLNMVIEVETTFEPFKLLQTCQSIENVLGRKREKRWGPRTIDLDILLYNQKSVRSNQLIIPHERMHERPFVLVPLHEINSMIYIPSVQKTVAEALSDIPPKEKEGIAKWSLSDNESR